MVAPTIVLIVAIGLGKDAFRQDYPADIQQAMPPATPDEKRAGLVWGSLFMVVLLAAMTLSTWLYLTEHPGVFNAYFAALGAGIVFLIYDLLIVDWLVICAWRPAWVMPRGTENCAGWGDYLFHAKVLCQAKVIAANLALPLLPAALAFGLHAWT